MTVRIAPSATRKPPSASERHEVKPSLVERSNTGPNTSPSAGLPSMTAESPARSAASGNTQGYATTDDTGSSVAIAIHGAKRRPS
ncbi:hypothetical protein [Gulosibacter sp. ACHW.36C]|uniref:Uncharacterized protein n=1 Tax=Gulosibacter sediminis TaxID=1729695 RepID=A0ABY4N1W5_9MICO|nr:hypothetical protein [Gulosibacter sediminis]UQN15626.1 hypothetical protein M3M28_04005 [Gulosibacter sediminis]